MPNANRDRLWLEELEKGATVRLLADEAGIASSQLWEYLQTLPGYRILSKNGKRHALYGDGLVTILDYRKRRLVDGWVKKINGGLTINHLVEDSGLSPVWIEKSIREVTGYTAEEIANGLMGGRQRPQVQPALKEAPAPIPAEWPPVLATLREPLLSLPIGALGLSSKSQNALLRADINRIGDLRSYTPRELLKSGKRCSSSVLSEVIGATQRFADLVSASTPAAEEAALDTIRNAVARGDADFLMKVRLATGQAAGTPRKGLIPPPKR